MASTAKWSIQLFGGLRVSGPGTEVDRFPTRRSALLLARVASARSGAMGRDELAEVLWPDDFVDATRLRLRQELNRLREALGPAAEILSSDRSWVRLNFDQAVVDVREFARLVSASDAERDRDTRIEIRNRALKLVNGPFLPEQSDDWVLGERHESHTRYLSTLIAHTDDLLEIGANQEALSCALRAVRADPYHEPARLAAMKAYVAMGDVGGAIRNFTEYEKSLLREFSVRPSDGIRTFFVTISAPSAVEPQAAPTSSTAVRADHSPMVQSGLPTYLESMIGREKEVAVLNAFLTSSPAARLVVVTGPGGVGKTRLAVATATECAAAFDGVVVYVGLADLGAGQRVLGRIQEAFGHKGAASSATPIPHWGNRRCLIVLDNAEHVLDDAQIAVKEILVAHPGISILATSRQRLGLGGEQEIPLAPLAVPSLSQSGEDIRGAASVQLFLERAYAIRPEYAPNEEQLESLAMLLERLDGLPLSIELAAARIGMMTPEQMLDEIDDRFTFLVSRRADVGQRQRSLRATIEWSTRLLDDDLREVLEILAAFRGGWTIDLAKQASGRADVVDLMHDLADRSLVHHEEVEGKARYTMLEAIREFILSDMGADKYDAIRKRHAEVVCDIVVEACAILTGPHQDRGYETIRAELNNARAAAEWAIEREPELAIRIAASIWRYFTARGIPSEGAQLLDAVLATEGPPTRDRGATSLGRGVIASLMESPGEAVKWHRRAADIFEEADNPRAVSWALMNMATCLYDLGRIDESYDAYQQALVHTGPYNIPLIQTGLAANLIRKGQTEDAMKLAERGFAERLHNEDQSHVGRAYEMLAHVYAECGRYEDVRGLLVESVERLRANPVRDFLLRSLAALAKEELRRNNMSEFDSLAEEAMSLATQIGDYSCIDQINGLLARRAAAEGRIIEAIRLYEVAIRPSERRECGISALQMGGMCARDLAVAGYVDEAKQIVAAEDELRAKLGCHRVFAEQRERDETVAITGEPDSLPSVSTVRDFVAKILAQITPIK